MVSSDGVRLATRLNERPGQVAMQGGWDEAGMRDDAGALLVYTRL